MAGPYTLTDGSGKSLYGSFSTNSDLDAVTIGQAACSVLSLPYLLLTTSTPNPAFGVPPDPTTGGPTPPGYFQHWISYQFAARPLAPSAWQQLVNQLRSLNPLTAGQLSELNPIIAALQSAGATFDTVAVTGALNASLYALQTQAWAANTGGPAWVEFDRMARAIYAQFPPPFGSTAAITFGVTQASPKVLPLPFDVTVATATQTTLFARSGAALSLIPSTSPQFVSLLGTAQSNWLSSLALKYPAPNATADATSAAAIAALATATANANAFLAIAGIV